MGVINAENMLKFKSSQQLFDRIKKRLSSFDAEDLIDDGDFHKHVVYILEELGQAVYKECEAVVEIKNHKGKMPANMRVFHAAMKCRTKGGRVKSVNEQKPLIYYQDTEISQECPPNDCGIRCNEDMGKTKIVIRNFVNGEDEQCSMEAIAGLRLAPGSTICTEDGKKMFRNYPDEITIDDDGYVHTAFQEDYIYIQYYGVPIDKNGLPMIPVNETIEKAIEYYILSQLFEDFYLNATVPNIGQSLQYINSRLDFYLPQARYWAKLPSFQKMVNSIRRNRSRNHFFEYQSDRTRVR